MKHAQLDGILERIAGSGELDLVLVGKASA